MGMTIDEKIEEDLKHCSLNGVKYSDYVKEHYISKDQYETRLKADMVAMLQDLDLQIDESAAYNREVAKVQRLIRDKINKLKENK